MQSQATLLSLYLPSSPLPPPLLLPPSPLLLRLQVTELFSGEDGMKRLRENYTESFSLTRQGKWRVETSNNFWEVRVRGQKERLKKRRTDGCRERERDRISRLGFEVVVNEGRKTERSELEKTENLYVDPYCGGRNKLWSKGHETEDQHFIDTRKSTFPLLLLFY